jgi:hypothetical protein
MNYAEKRLVSWTFSFRHYLRNSDTRPPATAPRAEIASRARMLIRHSSSTSFFFLGFLFHIHSSRGGVFSVGLLRENISLLARTFLSRISTRSWGSTLPSRGAAPMGRRHMVREGGKCPFRLSHIVIVIITILPSPPAYARKLRFQSRWPFILLCLWTCIILQVP